MKLWVTLCVCRSNFNFQLVIVGHPSLLLPLFSDKVTNQLLQDELQTRVTASIGCWTSISPSSFFLPFSDEITNRLLQDELQTKVTASIGCWTSATSSFSLFAEKVSCCKMNCKQESPHRLAAGNPSLSSSFFLSFIFGQSYKSIAARWIAKKGHCIDRLQKLRCPRPLTQETFSATKVNTRGPLIEVSNQVGKGFHDVV